MIPHTQTIFVNDPRGIPGDCMRTAVASLLDLPTEAVPHFVLFEGSGSWFTAFNMWLAGRKLRIKPLPAHGVTVECLAIGMSPRDVEHVVVWGPNGLVHDPHPSRAGLEPRQFWAIESNELSFEVTRLIDAGTTIQAIKQLRIERNLGLAEAKALVDEYRYRPRVET